jgi:hypothetical protein
MTKPTNCIIHKNHRIWISLILFMLLLSGCAGQDESKPVIQISVRSNRVEAQTAPRNVYAMNPALPSGVMPTATPLPTRTPTPDATVATAVPTATPTPTPPVVIQSVISVPIGRPERIVLPEAAIDTQIIPVYSEENQVGGRWFENWNTAAYAAGYHEGSALLGQAGNTVISGHNNIDGAVFQNLYQVQPGAEIYLYAKGYRYDYVVEDAFVVHEMNAPIEQRVQNASWISTTIDERVTLVSCWPPDGNAYRVIVIARPVSKMNGH